MASREGIPNKRNQELYYLAEKEGIDIRLIKLYLAGLRFDKLGYSKEQIESLTAKDLIEIQGRNANDLLPYFVGKRKPVDSEGNDSNDPMAALVEAISGSK